jgi:ATP-dependent helicase/nuclease subunit B
VKINVLAADNICEVNDKVLCTAAKFAADNQKHAMAPIFVIVPDRFTLQAEKIMTAAAACMLNVRVLTFSMLYNLVNGERGDTCAVLDKTTAVLFMWRAVQEVRGELVYFGRSAGQYAFGEKMFNTINQLASCMADFDKLEKNAKSDVTRRKMHDIALIQKKYQELTRGYIDGAGMLGWLIDNVGHSDAVRGAHVYLTGFEYLSVQREEVVRRLCPIARSFTVGARTAGELMRFINELRFSM